MKCDDIEQQSLFSDRDGMISIDTNSSGVSHTTIVSHTTGVNPSRTGGGTSPKFGLVETPIGLTLFPTNME